MIFLRLKRSVRFGTLLRQAARVGTLLKQAIGTVLILADSDIKVMPQATWPLPSPTFFKDVK